MKVIEPGCSYVLANASGNEPGQSLQLQLRKSGNNILSTRDGTTETELLLVLLDRLHYAQSEPATRCWENDQALTKVMETLMWLNLRRAGQAAAAQIGVDPAVPGADRTVAVMPTPEGGFTPVVLPAEGMVE